MDTRLDCNIPVRCESQGHAFDGRIVDLSQRGMRLLVSSPVERRARVTLSHPGEDGEVEAQVVWVRKVTAPVRIEVGMVFGAGELPAGSWIEAIFRTLSEGLARKLVRLGVDVLGKVHQFDGEGGVPVDCSLQNLGVGGCRFECPVEWPVATRVVLQIGPVARLQALAVSGSVIHCSPVSNRHLWQAGIEFDTDLDTEQAKLLAVYIECLAPLP